jgi:P pilus assembly protein, porin PapC
MKKKICRLTCFILPRIIFSLFISLIILTTCSLEGDMSAKRPKPGENHPPIIPDNNTLIVFDNTQGICAVSAYGDYRRRDEDKIAEIPAGGSSGKITYTPGFSVPFYFSYSVKVKGINDFILNYIPEIGKDQKVVRIDADTTTTIKIPTLSESISSPDTLLSNNSYILIQNNSSYSFELHQGTSKLKPDNISSPLVNNGERAQYTINPGPASNYRLLAGVDYKELSGSIVNFEAGHIYNFDFNGSISLVSDIELKLVNVNGIAIPQPPTTPVVITSNGTIALRWSAVESATAYEIWISTVNDSTSASKYGIDITGSLTATIINLNNGTTYYIWLKAKNILGTSGFSPVATGIPSASTVKPSDPQIAPSIIAGNGQLTVSWQAVIDTDVYEIWTGTTNNAQTATKQGGDVSGLSAVITGLNNGTNYYVWVKAKNTIGVSGFSPSATGKPLGTPGTPTLNSGPGQLLVTWTAVAGAEQYEVYYGTGTPTTLAATTAGTTVTISELAVGTTYYVRLRAKNASGISGYGPNASGVPNRTPGLYRGGAKISNQNLADSLTYILNNAVIGDEFSIVLGVNESISPKNLSYFGKTVGITLLGSGNERIITLSSNGSMFTVDSGVTLTLDENITIVGRSGNNASLVFVNNDGKLIMNDGAKISGNRSSSSSSSSFSVGGVYSTGTFTMNGGEISGNTASSSNAASSYGGGVYSSGTFTMNGGEISGNTASSYFRSSGGGVYSTGTFTMYGGEISGNTASSSSASYTYTSDSSGGGVYSSGTFTMYGGEISGNTASSSYSSSNPNSSSSPSNSFGGGVYSSGTFTMKGGEISGNTASSSSSYSSGGGVYVNSETFTKSGGGIITGYASDTVSGNVVKNSSGVVQNNNGHAVFTSLNSKRRNSTAGPGVNLDSSKDGVAGGWE